MIKNTIESYGSVSKFLHWFMAITLLCLLVVGFWLDDIGMPIAYKMHKTMGFMILLLVVARLIWKFNNVTPSYDGLPRLIALTAQVMHYILYALMIVTPLSAFISSNAMQYPVSFLFLFDLPSLFVSKDVELAKLMMKIHRIFALVLSWAISAHVLGALYHHFIVKDKILIRMLPNFLKFR